MAFCLIVIAWLVELIDWYFKLNLDQFGVVPRSLTGLRGVICMPWLHANWDHLLDNTIATRLGMIVILAEGRRFATTTLTLADQWDRTGLRI